MKTLRQKCFQICVCTCAYGATVNYKMPMSSSCMYLDHTPLSKSGGSVMAGVDTNLSLAIGLF